MAGTTTERGGGGGGCLHNDAGITFTSVMSVGTAHLGSLLLLCISVYMIPPQNLIAVRVIPCEFTLVKGALSWPF